MAENNQNNPNNPNNNGNKPNDLNRDVNEFVNSAVHFGTQLGSGVLDTISQAMNDAGFGGPKDPLSQALRWLRKASQQKYDNAIGLTICGWLFCGCFAIPSLVMAILWGSFGSAIFAILTVCFLAATLGFGWMGLVGTRKLRGASLMRKVARLASNWTVSVDDLARKLACNPAQLRQDLYQGIADGALPGACLDDDGRMLYIDATKYQPVPQKEQPASAAETPQESFRREGTNFLQYLHSCEGQLELSSDEELQRMEKTCSAIMGFVHNHPEQINRVRRFREYYIPTTRKLLDTARGLGDADTEGANNIRNDITGILHTLNTAYTKLYDSLLADVSMDVSAEIDTLETMLNQDGLTHDFASDFGLNNGKK